MFTQTWQTSAREYEMTIERDVSIPVGGGVCMKADIYRPKAPGRFPVILAASPYSKEIQAMPMMPVGFSYARGWMESGDPNFYVRRGYVMAIATIRGARGSGGTFGNIEPDPQTVRDLAEAIEWLGQQDWSTGKVGMNGVSYFSLIAKRVAMLKPASLAALFSPYGFTDGYRDVLYRGGILAAEFMEYWLRRQAPFFNIENTLRKQWGDEKYHAAVQAALRDPEIANSPALANALRNPDAGGHPVLVEILVNPLFNDYWKERVVDFDKGCDVPAYLGGDWGMFGLHLPGDLRAWAHWKGPKRLTLGPPIYLDRPAYQYAYESLRWFDHWLKGLDTGMMDEPPVQVFIEGTGQWRTSTQWPLPETRWTPFYLHRDGLLSEHEFWPNEGWSNYEDSMFARHGVEFWSPPMVETTELCGPSVLNLWGSTTDTDVLWFVSLLHRDAQGVERVLTRGWLRGTQRKLDIARSKPWLPVHTHDERQPLRPNEVYEFNIEVQSIGIELKPGERIGLRIKGCDNEVPATINEDIGSGAVARPMVSIVSVHHNENCPSHLLLPVTRGNRVGTFISGGKLPSFAKS